MLNPRALIVSLRERARVQAEYLMNATITFRLPYRVEREDFN